LIAMLRDQLVPGRILRLNWQFREYTREKYVALVGLDDNPLFLMVNSDVHPLVANDPARNQCQLPLPKSGHPFLDRDSVLDCSEVFDDHSEQQILVQLSNGDGTLVDWLSEHEKAAVRAILQNAATVSDWHRGLIIEGLG